MSMEIKTWGENPSDAFEDAYEAVFNGSKVDAKAWRERMRPGQSWALASPEGFLAAHERVEEDLGCDKHEKIEEEDETDFGEHDCWVNNVVPGMASSKRVVVNVWFMGVRPEARGSGAFRELVDTLLMEIWRQRGLLGFLNTQMTMTTRPSKFGKMFAILTMVAHRCDTLEDAKQGKARFRVPAILVTAALRRHLIKRWVLGVLVAVGLAYILPMTGVLNLNK